MKKRSNAYWKRRSNLRMAEYHKSSDSTIYKINNAYDKAIKDINEDINNIFYKYKLDSGLNEKEVRQLLNSKIPKKELDSIRARIHGIQDAELKNYMMAQLNANTYKARITRLEALKESIYINSKTAADVEIKQSTKLYTDNIKKAYYSNAFDIQKGLGVGFNIAEMPLESIQEILKNNWSGKHYSKRVWQNTDVLAQKLEEVITSGLMSGKSSRRMAMELEELTNYGKFAAERIIRTETTYISNAAEIESYEECGIDKYIFVATLDLRTSSVCREHDRKVYKREKAEVGINLPPLHPHCRSTTRAYLGKGTLEGIQRRARDPETGKPYLVPGDMDYNDWYDKFVVDKYGKDKTENFEKMIKNKSSDRQQLNKYKEVLGKESPKTLKDFTELKYNDIKEYKDLKNRFNEEFIKKDFKNIPSFHKNCSNLKTRQWYKWHDENIPNLISKSKAIKEQAMQAHELRNTYRTQARDLMKNQEERKELDAKHPNPSFEQLVEHKKLKYGLSQDEAYNDIIRSSQTTNKKYDKIAGIKEE